MKPAKDIIPDMIVAFLGLLTLILCFLYLKDKECDKIFEPLEGFIRVIIALASSAVSIALPGFINLETIRENNKSDTLWPKIKAGGALAVFVLVYLFNPIG
ncbi:hypothetical protein [uncultured Dokdonia sp.]|uniref:hypothetical protein n=1 Tax=uncultured Dokdonia sp. TaxID=575653 RepID=UPI0026144EA7|nr:hypothetical protein [uncultured Dokdonia sp.]